MKKILGFAIILAVVAIVAYLAYQYNIVVATGYGFEDVEFSVEQGDSVKEIAQGLSDAGLIRSKFFFSLYVKNQDNEAGLQAGDYVLNQGMQIRKIVSVLAQGRTISKEKEIKIIEGWRIGDIAKYLEKEQAGAGTQFTVLAKKQLSDWKLDFALPEIFGILPEDADLEGFLFPDTYRIYENAGAEDIIKKMVYNFQNKISPEMLSDIEKQGRSLFEVIAMASIVEKEVRGYEDMRIVSGIFWDRIKNGQALESCATLAYILGRDKPVYSYEDTQIDSPYNSYRHQGLPPGPISNPGLNAIKAAIYPVYTDYNFFLSASETGETIFSQTYDEHLRNKAKYVK